MKKINIYVKPPDGDVLLTCPPYVGDDELRRVLASKEAWIRRSRARIRKQHAASRSRKDAVTRGESLAGRSVPFLGEDWLLEIREDERAPKRGRAILRPGAGTIFMHLPPEAAGDPAQQLQSLRQMYRDALKEALPRSLARWQPKLGVEASSVRFRDMKTRWGSCNHVSGAISLNIRLARYDLSYFDQVVLHELVHLRVPNHGPDFYRLMDSMMPEWRKIRNELNRLPF